MLYKFFKAQWTHPTVNDWTEQAKQDLIDFGLNLDLDWVQSKSKWSWPLKSLSWSVLKIIVTRGVESTPPPSPNRVKWNMGFCISSGIIFN